MALVISLLALGRSAVAADNPIPFVNNPLAPSSVLPGSAQIELTLTGTGFVSGSVVHWNGSARATTLVSARKLTATIPASDLVAATSAFVTVVNPAPGGGRSNVAYFQVVSPRDTVTFGRRAEYAAGITDLAQPFNVITSDLDGDGNLDLASANVGDSNVSVFLGRGDGTFEDQVLYDASFAISLAAGDFNGDGAQDLAVLGSDNTHGGNGRLFLMLGNGDGTFQAPTETAAGNAPYYIAVGDLNRDGKLDAVVANYTTGSKLVSVFLGNGDGTFQPRATYAVGQYPQHVEIGDLNNDGRLDVVASIRDGAAPATAVLLGKGDGRFRPSTSTAFNGAPIWAALGDVNGDDNLDLAQVDSWMTSPSGVAVMPGNGNGTFGTPTGYATVANAVNVAVGIADLDGDNLQDLAVDTGGGVVLFLATSPGVFVKDARVNLLNTQSVAIGDFNRDGRPDVAAVNWVDEKVAVWVQTP
jgi:hypothetical protein